MDQIRVLYIEPDTEAANTLISALQTTTPEISVRHVDSGEMAVDLLSTESVDCVVTEWQLPSLSGTSLLQALRTAAPTVPIVCFTDCSAAITADLFAFESTDYLYDQPDVDQSLVVAARIRSAVGAHGSSTDFEAQATWQTPAQYRTILESVQDGVCILDSSLDFVYVNGAFAELTGYSAAELLESNASLITDTADMETTRDRREKLFSGDEDAAMLTGEITTADGERLPIEAWMTPLQLVDGEQGTVSVVRDISFRKHTEAMFTALYEAAHDLLSVQSNQEIADIAVEAATSVLGFEDAIVLRYDGETNAFHPLAYTPSAEKQLPEMPSIDGSEDSVASQAFFETELIAAEDMRTLSNLYDPETPYRRAMFIPVDDHGVLFVGDTDTGTIHETTHTVAELLGATVAAAFDRLSSERQSQAHRQTLAEQTAELEALTHTNELVRAFGDRLFSASTREEIEEAVCSVILSFDRYRFAWIGAAESRGDAIVPRTFRGHEQGYLDWLEHHCSEIGRSAVDEPAYRALDNETPVSTDRISRDWKTEPWRKEALSRGYQSILSVPLRHRGVSYGVLSVYADAPGAFDEYTRTLLTEFGRIIAYAIGSTETKQGLLTDHRTEVELDITDENDALHRLAAGLDQQLSFEGFVPQDDDQSLLFFSVTDSSTAAVEAAAAETYVIQRLREVTQQNDTTLFEAAVSGPVLASTLVDCGAVPAEIETDGEQQRVVVALPQTTDVRTFVERLQVEYPSATIVSRRNRDHGIQSRETFRMQLFDSLTERQAETLRAAYFARYFDSPRGSTGTEVGQSLGISQPTFNYHLRAALRTLLTMLFEETS